MAFRCSSQWPPQRAFLRRSRASHPTSKAPPPAFCRRTRRRRPSASLLRATPFVACPRGGTCGWTPSMPQAGPVGRAPSAGDKVSRPGVEAPHATDSLISSRPGLRARRRHDGARLARPFGERHAHSAPFPRGPVHPAHRADVAGSGRAHTAGDSRPARAGRETGACDLAVGRPPACRRRKYSRFLWAPPFHCEFTCAADRHGGNVSHI